MSGTQQLKLFSSPELAKQVEEFICSMLASYRQPSARELLAELEQKVGLESRWDLPGVLRQLADDAALTRADRDYIHSLLEGSSLSEALRGDGAPGREVVSTIDTLLRQSKLYRSSDEFRELLDFMSLFRDYAPYNNMLVRVQNPSCSFYATAKDWQARFRRNIKEDARPMLILAPMSPVMLVYDLDQTEGPPLPAELTQFAHFNGEWEDEWLTRLVGNAGGYRIRVGFKPLSSTLGGFATIDRASGDWKMRIAIHDELDGPSRFGVLCHELAHILLGHLGTDKDHWWPGRSNLDRATVEVEAESVAYIVTSRLGLSGASAAYVSRHLKDGRVPAGVSMDFIAKVAGQIERMAREVLPARRPKTQHTKRGRA
jgi:hypothetical protein